VKAALRRVWFALLAGAAAGPAFAQSDAQSAAAAMPGPVCADRPGKGTSTCTVDQGHWQVEVDAADWTHDRSGGVTTEFGVFAQTSLKYGLTDRLDVELTITPWETSRVGSASISGFGDLLVRAKWGLTGQSGPFTAALDPYLKLPTARDGLGNGAYEGGLVAPTALALPEQFSLAFTPELDLLENASGHGRHVNYAATLGLGRPLTPTVTGGIELWGGVNDDPSGQVRQASFDLTLAWIPAGLQSLQLDGGLNLGLNRSTPQTQLYVGISRRF
jgi:hypothetical protein